MKYTHAEIARNLTTMDRQLLLEQTQLLGEIRDLLTEQNKLLTKLNPIQTQTEGAIKNEPSHKRRSKKRPEDDGKR